MTQTTWLKRKYDKVNSDLAYHQDRLNRIYTTKEKIDKLFAEETKIIREIVSDLTALEILLQTTQKEAMK